MPSTATWNVWYDYPASHNHHPDHDTIASFRQRNKDYIKHAFVTTVKLAQELWLTNLGTMAIDGTSLRANAGRKTSMTYNQLDQLAISLCEERVAQAAQADEQEKEAQIKGSHAFTWDHS